MKKKLIMLGSIMLLLCCLIFSYNYENRSFSIRNHVSAETSEEIKATRTKQSEIDFSCLLCNESRIPFDDESNTFFLTVNMEDDTWEGLTFESGQPEYEIIFPEDLQEYEKGKMVARGTGFPVIVYNESFYAEYDIVFSGMPFIDITTDVGIWQENIRGVVTFYDTDFVKQGFVQSDYQAHLRGNTSRVYPKKGYKMNLVKHTASDTVVKNPQAVFGMREDDDWILYAMYNDETKIRDRLSIDLWNAFGAGEVSDNAVYGTNLTYVEVVADNSYCGIYGLMEPIDAKQLDLNAEDYLYKRKTPHGMNYEKFSVAADPYAEVNGFEIKAGTMDETAWDDIANLSYLLNCTTDETFAELAPGMIDIDNAARMWLFMQIITGHDQRAKNVFYVAKQEKDGCKFYFAPWDMDLTWGNVSVGEVNPLYTAFEMDTYDDDVPWETADRLIFGNVNGAADLMQEIYLQLRETVLSDEVLETHILELDNYLRESGAYARDRACWPEGAHADDCEILITYAKKRLEFLDNALFDLDNYD